MTARKVFGDILKPWLRLGKLLQNNAGLGWFFINGSNFIAILPFGILRAGINFHCFLLFSRETGSQEFVCFKFFEIGNKSKYQKYFFIS